MTPQSAALIVDDERFWREFYESEARQIGIDVIRVAENLDEAEKAIEAMRFAVAVVDVGLDENDDRNVDGLEVMQKIRDSGDQTSIIVVTGRSGRDVLPIVRDSIKKYGAFDAAAKSTLLPEDLRKLLEKGNRAYREEVSDQRQLVRAAARGDVPQPVWDERIMRETHIKSGVVELYAMLDGLLSSFVPLLAGRPKGINAVNGIARGSFWSRGIGHPVIACFGEEKIFQKAMEEARLHGALFGVLAVQQIVKEYRSKTIQGAVYVLRDSVRSDFDM